MPDQTPTDVTAAAARTRIVLGIDSDTDPETVPAFDYRNRNVYPHFIGFGIVKRQQLQATHSAVGPQAAEPAVVYITGLGHGTDSIFFGAHAAPVFEVGVYSPDEADGKIIHLLSCNTAEALGMDFVRNGCRAFFGYVGKYVYVPADADTFFECDAEIDRAFAEGLTAAQVYDRVRQLVALRAAALPVTSAAALENNFDNLRCPSSAGGAAFGDPAALLA